MAKGQKHIPEQIVSLLLHHLLPFFRDSSYLPVCTSRLEITVACRWSSRQKDEEHPSKNSSLHFFLVVGVVHHAI